MQKQKIILDCDPGYDDAVAILLAVGSPEIELLGVTTVAGNQSIEKVTRNALRILKLLGREVITVAQGAYRPLVRGESVACPHIHGESGLDGTTLPEAPYRLDSRCAAQFIVETVMREPAGTVTLVPIGPLTNIALAARIEPRIVERVKEVVLMGGGYHIGNVAPMAEFNIENDPEAAHIVFEEPWKIVMVGLDLTNQAQAVPQVRQRLAKITSPAGVFLGEVLEQFAAKYKKSRGFDAPPVHDACAVAYVIDNTVMTLRQAPVHVEYRGVYTSGMTVTDFRRKAPENCHTFVATELDKERFWNLVERCVSNL